MKEYITIIDYLEDTQQYQAHVRTTDSSENLFSSSRCNNTKQALQETQSYFTQKNIPDTVSINSSVKSFPTPAPTRAKCCGR